MISKQWITFSLLGFVLLMTKPVRIKADTNSAIVWGGAPCEISLAEVSDRTAQLVIAPLEDHGQPQPIPPTAAFVTFPSVEKFSAREFAGSRDVQVGEMRFIIKAKPLTISAYRADGSLVQEFILDGGTNGTVSFCTIALVFGLGEGGEQFDRHGHFYPMKNGQINPMLAEHETTIPVPFLIGTDGRSFFVRTLWGKLNLRGKQGLFLPERRQLGRESLTIYISELDKPTDALTEDSQLRPREWYYTTHNPGTKWTHVELDYKVWIGRHPNWRSTRGGFGSVVDEPAGIRTHWDGGDQWLRKPFVIWERDIKNLTLHVCHAGPVEIYFNEVPAAKLTGSSHGKFDAVAVNPNATVVLQPTDRLNTLAITAARRKHNPCLI